MLPPRKVKFEARKKENENLQFRTFLKCNANEEELDRQFLKLHNELFEDYDCSRCRNCCKMYCGSIPEKDMKKDAEYLGMEEAQFKEKFLKEKDSEGNYATKHRPCDFLQETVLADLENADLKIVKNIHILTNRNDLQVYIVF